jgi:vacuolar-type H+-ATPase subunit C/Vma6
MHGADPLCSVTGEHIHPVCAVVIKIYPGRYREQIRQIVYVYGFDINNIFYLINENQYHLSMA